MGLAMRSKKKAGKYSDTDQNIVGFGLFVGFEKNTIINYLKY